MKKSNLFFVMLILFTLSFNSIDACTIIAISNGETILVGNNEDFSHTFTSYWTVPSTKDEYGRIYFGFNFNGELNPCGGVNEKGLFIDGCSVDPPNSPTGYSPEKGKKKFNGNVEEYVLAHCATLNDVKEFFATYNVGLLSRGKWLVAEKSGASMVVEWGKRKIQFLERTGNYQISTNFTQTKYSADKIPCHRYNIVQSQLDKDPECSIDLMRKLLSITALGGGQKVSTTLYSYICDLKNGNIYLYNFHNFEDVVKINIFEELSKGEVSNSILSQFPYETFSEKLYKLIQPQN